MPKVIQVRHTKGNSTVFENLYPFTTYTVCVGSYNDNKKRQEDATEHTVFKTKMSAGAKFAAQLFTTPTIIGPGAIAYAQRTDENIDQSDDEFEADPGIYPSVPEELKWKLYGFNEIKVDWKLPTQNSEEVHHFKVQVSEEDNEEMLYDIESYGTSETFKLADTTKNYEVRVT